MKANHPSKILRSHSDGSAIAVLGNAITSRIDFSPAKIIAIQAKSDKSIKKEIQAKEFITVKFSVL
jgi:hypothetical protein